MKIKKKKEKDIPPRQGGKYTGFGNKPLHTSHDNQNDSLAEFQKKKKDYQQGWNYFLISTVYSFNDNIIKLTSNAVRDPNFTQNIENHAESF